MDSDLQHLLKKCDLMQISVQWSGFAFICTSHQIKENCDVRKPEKVAVINISTVVVVER